MWRFGFVLCLFVCMFVCLCVGVLLWFGFSFSVLFVVWFGFAFLSLVVCVLVESGL